MKTIFKILFVALFLQSCDCNQVVSGTIADERGLPIYNATIYNKNKTWNKIQSDSLGEFELHNVSGGFFRCPPMRIVIEKPGYKTITTTIDAGGSKTITLEKD